MKKPEPDFERFRAAITRQSLPDRLPIAEGSVAPEMMEAFLGRPIASVKEFAQFWKEAGYDYTILNVRGQPLPDHFNQYKVGQQNSSVYQGGNSLATFDVPLGVKDEKTFEKYPWIGPQDVYYGDVDAIKDFLPCGMKLVVSQGPLF